MTAQGFSHSEFLVVGLVFFALGIVLLTVAKFWPLARRPKRAGKADATAAQPSPHVPPGAAIDAPSGTPDWPALIDACADELDANARSSLLTGLGIVGDRWSIGVLATAFDQEAGPLKVEAIDAIGGCDDEIVAPMLALAYASPVVEERFAAVDGASRRGDLPLLERGLRDADVGVALAAAYGLQRAGRADLVPAGLAVRSAAEAVEIRRVLAILV